MSDERSGGQDFDPSRTQPLPGGQGPGGGGHPGQWPGAQGGEQPPGQSQGSQGGQQPPGQWPAQPPQDTPGEGQHAPPRAFQPDPRSPPLADPRAPNPPETPGWAALPGGEQLHTAASGPQPGARGAVWFVGLVALVTLVALVALIVLLLREGPSLNLSFDLPGGGDPGQVVFTTTGQVAAGESARVDLPPLGPGTLRIDVLGQDGLDPIIQVYDAGGRRLAEDDDGGSGLNSRVELSTPTAAPFAVVVRDFNDDAGSFAVEVRLRPQA